MTFQQAEDASGEEPVALAPYDADWPRIFMGEAQRLRSALVPFGLQRIEHVGSTAIPGMSAKPIVDVMAGVEDVRRLPAPRDPLWRSLGYVWGHGAAAPDEWLYFIKRDAQGNRVAHVHLVRFEGEFWNNLIAFRDALREDAALAEEYRQLKSRLASRYGNDRARYRDEKAAFVSGVVALRGAAQLRRFSIERDDVRISIVDFGGDGPPALLLHGLYGGAHEWTSTARWLKQSYRVFALDQRGHGESTKGAGDVSIDALANDAIAVLEHLDAGPALVVGQSMGAVVGMLLSSRRADLVKHLVLIEGHAQSDSARSAAADWLRRWPLPFPDLTTAARFFRSQRLEANAWLPGLVRDDEGYKPKCCIEDMRSIEAHLRAYDYRDECAQIPAATLVVAGSRSWLDAEKIRALAELLPRGEFQEISGAGHEVHLDAPGALRACVMEFVDR